MKKKYKHQDNENNIMKFWESQNVYEFKNNGAKEMYSIDTPPPTVSGTLHIGHIFSYTQAEIIARFKRMMGYNVFYPFGFDDNGLPTERLVENELNIKAKDMSREEFTKSCFEISDKYELEFKDLWTRLGFSCDWSLAYKTISPLSQRISQKSFIELYNKKLAYIQESPVLYCTHCQTSIAQAELESKEVSTTFNYIKFKVDDCDLVIATTRPELVYGCCAIFINPKDTVNSKLIGKEAVVPLYDFKVPILSNDDVVLNKGSGVVMCCTFGDTKDLQWYKEYNFKYIKTVKTDGNIESSIPLIGGLYVKKARNVIIEILKNNDYLIKSENIIHTVSVHERCSNEVEIIPSKQWYINIMDHKQEFLNLADEINWYPLHMKSRYISWVENLKWDWCISRQRYFGVPFPVWYCKNCGEIIIADNESLPVNPLSDAPRNECSCGNTEYLPETAVLDTWATSSTTPLINSHWKENDLDITKEMMPMGMRTQAHEIIRTWAFYTIVKSYYHLGIIPWKDIMICGFVLARKGEKMSKSKKNSKLEPIELIKTHSADSIRYWAASAKLGTDITFAEEDLKISKRFLTKLWNASKFSIMHLSGYEQIKPEYILPQDNWIIQSMKATLNKMIDYLNQFEIGLARNVLDEFFWKDYCDNYLELVKDRLYNPENHNVNQKSSAQYAIYITLFDILKAYSIFTPFICEKIYQEYYVNHFNITSIHLLEWDLQATQDVKYLDLGIMIKEILSVVRKYKSEKFLSIKEPIEKLVISMPVEKQCLFNEVILDLKAVTHANSIIICNDDNISVKVNE